MTRICSICTHDEREAIDQALVSGSTSNRSISTQYSVTESSLRRHKESGHISAVMAKAQDAREVARGDDLVAEIRKIHKATLNILITTYNSGEYGLTLKAVREARGNLELMGKLLGELQQQPNINVLVTSPDWLQLRAAVIGALAPYPEARQAVVEAINGIVQA